MRNWLLALSVFGLSMAVSSAQTPTRTDDAPTPRLRLSRLLNESAANEIHEDIEIMRRLLARKVTTREGLATSGTASSAVSAYIGQAFQGYQSTNVDQYHPWKATLSASGVHVGQVEGVYLGSKGAVFTMTLPASNRDPRPTKLTAAPAVVTEWERARQALRGETPEPTTKTESTQPSIADNILKVLAENGKNIHIRDDEDVIVVVTFRGEVATTAMAPAYSVPTVDVPSNPLASVTQPAAPPTDVTGSPGHGKSARDFELLGDLHLRQKQYQQAMEAYHRAVTLQPDGDPKQLAETFRKLAETKLQLGRLDEAKVMIESAVEWEKKSKAGGGPAKPSPKPKAEASWPTKLLIVANKRQLDDVGSGKMTFEDFRSKVAVELVSPKDKKPGGG